MISMPKNVQKSNWLKKGPSLSMSEASPKNPLQVENTTNRFQE